MVISTPWSPTASAPTIGLGQRVQRQSGAGAGDGGGRCPWPGGGFRCGMHIENMTIDIELLQQLYIYIDSSLVQLSTIYNYIYIYLYLNNYRIYI